jgi:serine-type D-Ala-D-Ala carboxypeptidase/endopeptidase (penicillin-binding protein 4)
MKKIGLLALLFAHQICIAQKWQEPMQTAVDKLCKDATMKHGCISLTIMNANTGEIVFEKNSDLGLPTASTQKIITSICVYELLGTAFTYSTSFTLQQDLKKNKTNLLVKGSYDPTLGSWRYASTNSDVILDTLSKLLKARKINQVKIIANPNSQTLQNHTSDGWIYEDLGNYYGAACEPLMWKENQYDLQLMRDDKNKQYSIQKTSPSWLADILQINPQVKFGANNSGDNTCIYRMPFGNKAVVKGTIGADLSELNISGSIEGGKYFSQSLNRVLNSNNITNLFEEGNVITKDATPIYVHKSPSMDSMQYWFLHKSINLYGEAFLRTMAIKKYNNPSYEKGIEYIHSVCKQLKIDTQAVHIFDGCGLSPQNRISTKALATFLRYAYGRDYYKQFYNCLPIINDISMKSGSIHGARAYTGYIKSSDDTVYTFAIAVNNYDGSGKEMQSKLWKVLDVLK